MNTQEIIKILTNAGIEENEAICEVKMLLEHFCNYTEMDKIKGRRLNNDELKLIKENVIYRVKNRIPVQHIIGKAWFMGEFFKVTPDVLILRDFLNNNGGERIKIISKIENLEGIDNFDSILEVSDGIMVARGDMGVEVPYAQIPGIQKRFIRKCNEWGKIVITATQMLESMTNNIMPTRAEITDVANAVFDGTSAVMLSGETTVGKHPVLVVKAMYKIVEQAEKDKKVFEKVKIKAENKQLERELQRYDAYTTDTRVLTAVAKFMEAPMEHRDAALMEVIRVLNNAKNKYDKMKLTKKIKGAE
jgi:pyruvate kinase